MARAVSRSAGFTLIEVVVVLLLIGIISALVVVNAAPDDRQQVRSESERLAALFEQASMDARVSGETIAWSSDGRGYRFQEKSPDSDWTDMDGDVYRPRELPKNMEIQTADVGQVGLAAGAQLLFRPSGINPPYDVVMTLQHLRMRISGDIMNRVTVEPYHLGQ